MINSAKEILRKLSQYGEAYIVGGTVRDIILNKEIHDVDIATNVPINIIDSIFNTHDIGKNRDFGIVVVKYNNFNFEIANFRSDGEYTDGRRPNSIKIAKTFKEDAARRDFTINALAMDVNDNIIDFYNGKDDINNKILRTVGNPYERFNEDKLRLLRAVRFAARFDFSIEEETKKSIIHYSQWIRQVSSERIRDEIYKAASNSKIFARYIEILSEVDLLRQILPEVEILKEFEHSPDTHPE